MAATASAFSGSADNVVESNRIGTNVAGTAAMANGGNGIWVTAGSNGNTIGGTASSIPHRPAERPDRRQGHDRGDASSRRRSATWCRATARNGILIDTGSQNNVLSGNFVGTDVSGNTALGNVGDGVAINGADNNSLIGCTFVRQPVRLLQRDQRQRRQRHARHQLRQHD